MPTKNKVTKPKIRVEEINTSDEKPDEANPEIHENSASHPKIASFSQLDVKDQQKESLSSSHEVPETIFPDTSEKPPEEKGSVDKSPQETSVEENIPPMKDEEKDSSEEIKEWLKEVRPDTSKEIEKSAGPNFKIIFVVLMLFAILGTVVGGVIYYRKNVSSSTDEQAKLQPTSTPVPSATPTPQPVVEEVDFGKISVSVLNGSGLVGEASKVKTKLVGGGFTETNVRTGNADSYNYDKTEVSLKGRVSEKVYEATFRVLSSSYDVVKSESPLSESSDYDVEIIVGKPK